MILPRECVLSMEGYKGKGTVIVAAGKRTLIHGDAKTIVLTAINNDISDDNYHPCIITLDRSQAQQLADDINFLLG